ncbi:hypothetical protein HG531_012614 [Fusarium graminearum]|nr:hypothetical protein HG531_012614 [Fusarium graminearum]
MSDYLVSKLLSNKLFAQSPELLSVNGVSRPRLVGVDKGVRDSGLQEIGTVVCCGFSEITFHASKVQAAASEFLSKRYRKESIGSLGLSIGGPFVISLTVLVKINVDNSGRLGSEDLVHDQDKEFWGLGGCFLNEKATKTVEGYAGCEDDFALDDVGVLVDELIDGG